MEELLQVEGLWKKYSRSLSASARYAARDLLRNAIGAEAGNEELRDTEFWSLREVNFTLRRGEVMAVVGYNGAGKSTLLKCIAGKLPVDRGKIVRRGKLGHLLEMSAGFSPSMTGRDNVSVRGRLIGKQGKELNRYISQVAEFADIDEFFDAPVQFYSSGMKARLGFAASSVMEPDILILDEVLAVGDLGFRMKCYSRIDEIRKKSAVILVSHSMGHISRLATTSIFLNKGKVVFQGAPQKSIALYNEAKGSKKKAANFKPECIRFEVTRNHKVIEENGVILFGEELSFQGECFVDVPITLSIFLHEQGGAVIGVWNSKRSNFILHPSQRFSAKLGPQNLSPGYYHLSVIGIDSQGEQLFLSIPFNFRVKGDFYNKIGHEPIAAWNVL